MSNLEVNNTFTVVASQPKTTTIVIEKQGPPGVSGKSQLTCVELTDSISADYTLETLHKYLINRNSLIRLQLPNSEDISLGDIIVVINLGASPWRITQDSVSQIQIGKYSTTLGVTGYIESTSVGDRIELEYLLNNRWSASVQGNVLFN